MLKTEAVSNSIVTDSADETRELGRGLSEYLRQGDVVFLEGELGSGKTTLVQGIANGLGIKGFIRSSSFVIVNEYFSPDIKLYHMDLYRLPENEIPDMGLEEYLFGDGICVVEWAEKIKMIYSKPAFEIFLEWRGENTRKIVIKRRNPGVQKS